MHKRIHRRTSSFEPSSWGKHVDCKIYLKRSKNQMLSCFTHRSEYGSQCAIESQQNVVTSKQKRREGSRRSQGVKVSHEKGNRQSPGISFGSNERIMVATHPRHLEASCCIFRK
ncbi:hypothetical protein AVEN_265694-1 [Araneus ventricosus]|uniref:Uncharacterized protein n=1 Tax=Araneus ventricosus TaxID=182803 RepID=A0A4Y2N7C4_ARAVE|nr:hypothetical protein AVEN_265694-1 [Araneus ventricosus]